MTLWPDHAKEISMVFDFFVLYEYQSQRSIHEVEWPAPICSPRYLPKGQYHRHTLCFTPPIVIPSDFSRRPSKGSSKVWGLVIHDNCSQQTHEIIITNKTIDKYFTCNRKVIGPRFCYSVNEKVIHLSPECTMFTNDEFQIFTKLDANLQICNPKRENLTNKTEHAPCNKLDEQLNTL